MRDACDAGKVRVLRIRAWTCSLSRQINRRFISMRRQSSKYMYDHHIYQSMDQPGKVANPAHGQLNRENEYYPVPVRA